MRNVTGAVAATATVGAIATATAQAHSMTASRNNKNKSICARADNANTKSYTQYQMKFKGTPQTHRDTAFTNANNSIVSPIRLDIFKSLRTKGIANRKSQQTHL